MQRCNYRTVFINQLHFCCWKTVRCDSFCTCNAIEPRTLVQYSHEIICHTAMSDLNSVNNCIKLWISPDHEAYLAIVHRVSSNTMIWIHCFHSDANTISVSIYTILGIDSLQHKNIKTECKHHGRETINNTKPDLEPHKKIYTNKSNAFVFLRIPCVFKSLILFVFCVLCLNNIY